MRSHAKAVVAVSAVLLLTLVLAASPASAEAPTVSIDPPSDVAYTTAKVSGTVDPKDLGTWWSFETSSDGGASWSGFNFEGNAGEGSGSQAVPSEGPLQLSGLAPGTEYKVRLVANNFTDPEVFSPVESFETLEVAKPSVTLDPVSAIGGEEARFEGTVNPNAPEAAPVANPEVEEVFATTYRFECTPACPGIPEQTIPAGNQAHTVSVDAEGLDPDTAYTVRLLASNRGGEEVAEQSFETGVLPPIVATGTVGALTHNSARLTAYVDPNNSETTATVEYDTDPSFGSPTVAVPVDECAGVLEPCADPKDETVSGNGSQVAFVDVSGLTPEATYHWRVSVQSSEGSDADTAPRGFAPWPVPPAKGDGVGAFGDRVIERVSPSGEVGFNGGGLLSDDGNKVLYTAVSGSDVSTYGTYAQTLATRTALGWKASDPMPSRSAIGTPQASLLAISSDFSRMVGLALPRQGGYGSRPMFRHIVGTDNLEWGMVIPASAPNPEALSAPDASSVVAIVDEPLVPEDPSTIGGVYELGGSAPELISRLPNGDAPTCGVSGSEFATRAWSRETQHWISTDGERIFFQTKGNDCDGPSRLYMREGGVDGSTTLISGPILSGPDLGGHFAQATADGSQVFFTSASVLDPADVNSGRDLYRHTVGAGNTCLTCALPDADIAVGGEGPRVLVAEDGSRAYFVSTKVLTPGAVSGSGNLYVWRTDSPDTLGYVGLAPEGMAPGDSALMANRDGSALVFQSSRPELDTLTGRPNGGLPQFYRYDDDGEALQCLSCPAPGVDPVGTPGELGTPAMVPMTDYKGLSLDGRSLFFSTPEVLVSQDVNQVADIYEWRGGRVGLVTDGLAAGDVVVRDLSDDGRTLVFNAERRLTADSPDNRGAVYVARIGGGFPKASVAVPCGGDTCKGNPTSPPAESSLGSSQFSGPLDRASKPRRCAKGKARRNGRCVKRKPSQRKHSHRGKRANVNPGGGK